MRPELGVHATVGTRKDGVAATVPTWAADGPAKQSFDYEQHVWVGRRGVHKVRIVAETVPLPTVPTTSVWLPANARADSGSRPRVLRPRPRLDT